MAIITITVMIIITAYVNVNIGATFKVAFIATSIVTVNATFSYCHC